MRVDAVWAAVKARRIVLLLLVLMGIGAGTWFYTIPDHQYEATATVALWNPAREQVDAGANMRTEARVANSQEVAKKAIDDLGLDMSAPVLAENVSVQIPAGSAVVDITATAESPEKAVLLADAVAKAYVEYRIEWSNQLRLVEDSVALEGEVPERAVVLNTATAPTSAAGPPFVAYPIAGAGLLFLCGMALVLILKRHDLRTPPHLVADVDDSRPISAAPLVTSRAAKRTSA